MACDVVVVEYKTPQLLTEFITSYNRSKFLGCTLTVVRNEYSHYLSINDDRADNYLAFADNLGFGKACNEGAQWGNNDCILFANADTLLTPELVKCYDVLMSNPDWGLLGPRQRNENGLITHGGIFGADYCPQQRGWNDVSYKYADVRTDACFVSGSLFLIKRAVWDELNQCPLYRESHPNAVGAMLETRHYFEDTWLGYHARAHGYKCTYYGPVEMIHYWHKSSPHGSEADKQMEPSKKIFRETCAHHGIVCE